MISSSANLRFFFRLALTFLLITLATAIYGISPGISWAGLRPSPCYPGCFCEMFHRGAIVQPLSSFSNLWYVLVGLCIIASARIALPGNAKRTNLLLRQPVYINTYGIVVIGIGLTSFFYHVSLTLVGRWVDYIGMYAFAIFAVTYNLARLRIVRGRAFTLIFTALNLSLAIPMMAISSLIVKRALLMGAIVAMLGLEGIIYFVRRPPRLQPIYLLAALGVMVLATGLNMLDESGQLCNHASLWQWHAVWHFLTAVATGLLYLYYRAEEDGERYPAGN
jgi:hypothetical protein